MISAYHTQISTILIVSAHILDGELVQVMVFLPHSYLIRHRNKCGNCVLNNDFHISDSDLNHFIVYALILDGELV